MDPWQDLSCGHAALFQQCFGEAEQVCPLRGQDIAGSLLCSVEARAHAGPKFIVSQQHRLRRRQPKRSQVAEAPGGFDRKGTAGRPRQGRRFRPACTCGCLAEDQGFRGTTGEIMADFGLDFRQYAMANDGAAGDLAAIARDRHPLNRAKPQSCGDNCMPCLVDSVTPQHVTITPLRWQAQLFPQHTDTQRFSGLARLGTGRAYGCGKSWPNCSSRTARIAPASGMGISTLTSKRPARVIAGSSRSGWLQAPTTINPGTVAKAFISPRNALMTWVR